MVKESEVRSQKTEAGSQKPQKFAIIGHKSDIAKALIALQKLETDHPIVIVTNEPEVDHILDEVNPPSRVMVRPDPFEISRIPRSDLYPEKIHKSKYHN